MRDGRIPWALLGLLLWAFALCSAWWALLPLTCLKYACWKLGPFSLPTRGEGPSTGLGSGACTMLSLHI